MIYVKAVAMCDTAPETKRKCKAKKSYDILVELDLDRPSLPIGWGRYLSRVLCPKCANKVRKMYHPTSVTS